MKWTQRTIDSLFSSPMHSEHVCFLPGERLDSFRHRHCELISRYENVRLSVPLVFAIITVVASILTLFFTKYAIELEDGGVQLSGFMLLAVAMSIVISGGMVIFLLITIANLSNAKQFQNELRLRGYDEFSFKQSMLIAGLLGFFDTGQLPFRDDIELYNHWGDDPVLFVWTIFHHDLLLKQELELESYSTGMAGGCAVATLILPIILFLPFLVIRRDYSLAAAHQFLIVALGIVGSGFFILLFYIKRVQMTLRQRGWFWIRYRHAIALWIALPAAGRLVPRREEVKCVPGFRDGDLMFLVNILKDMRANRIVRRF